MSRSVSAPSSVTKTSPCWNGLIVPGSTLRYGSNFWSCTLQAARFEQPPERCGDDSLPQSRDDAPVSQRRTSGPVRSRDFRVAAAAAGAYGSIGRTTSRAPRQGTPAPPSIRSSSAFRSSSPSCSMRVCVGSPGRLLDAEVAVGERGDLRKVRDRHDLRVLGEPLEQPADGVRRLAADPGVDLVEDERVAAGDGRDRERDPRELAAGGRLGDRCEREAGVRADEEDGVVGSGRARLVALAKLADELAVAHADVAKLGGDGVGERGRGGVPLGAQLERELVDALLRRRELARARPRRDRRRPRGRRARPARPRRRASSSSYVSQRKRRFVSAIRSSSASSCSSRPGSASREARKARRSDAVSRRRSSMSRSSSPARFSSGAMCSSGATERSASADEAACSVAFVRRERRGRRGRAVASSATWRCRSRSARSRSSSPGSIPSVSSTSARSSASRASASAAFAVSSSWRRRAACRSRHAARAASAAGELLLAAEAVEHLELVRRPREPALLELARHRDDALDRSGDVFPRGRSPPRVGARAAVGEDTPRDDERVLVLRPQLARARRARPEDRARPRRTPLPRPRRRTRRRPSRRAAARAPARGSSCPRRSRR